MRQEVVRAALGLGLFLLLVVGVVVLGRPAWGPEGPRTTPLAAQGGQEAPSGGGVFLGEPIIPPRPAPHFTPLASGSSLVWGRRGLPGPS